MGRFKYLIAGLLVLLINASILGIYTDISASMADTLIAGDSFLVLKFWYGLRLPLTKRIIKQVYQPKSNDVLIFSYPLDPRQIHIKRCVASGGQTVEIIEKKLYVDGAEIPLPAKGKHDDPDIIPKGPSGSGKRDFIPRVVVPDSTLFVMGDNRDYSIDSRIWGFLPEENVRGKVWMIILSTNPEVSWLNIKRKIRWDRMFKRVL